MEQENIRIGKERFFQGIFTTNANRQVQRLSDIHHPDIHHLRHSSPPDWIQTFITLDFHHPLPKIRHSSPRHSSPQTFITHSCRIRHSSPRTFITSDIHHLRHSSPQTFITSDIHHPLAKIRHSSPQTFITSDIHHLRWWTSEVMNVWIQHEGSVVGM